MDLSRIFMKNATPTKIGGQAIMEGIMMRGPKKTAVCIRMPDHALHMKIENNKEQSRWMKVPIIRGCVSFFASLVQGTKTLMYSADVLEAFEPEAAEVEAESWLDRTFGKEKSWTIMMYASVVFALIFTIGIFIILPTAVVKFLERFTSSAFVLNLIEGVIRIALFIGYVAAIRLMNDIRRVFQFHGAEHKTIHCYENHLELTPENADGFYTLHPRCGTSFLMFVMVLTVLFYACLGWPSLLWRIVSRLLLLPVIAGGSYELLRWAGRSDSPIVKAISLPGIYLQKLTTCEPDFEHLEVAIAAMHAAEGEPLPEEYEGPCDLMGRPCDHDEAIRSAMTGYFGKEIKEKAGE
ncbi:MAG: DUF1385 domain-containing protein [Firmicutes bacterium]|nr:DUF1385 domain-containing protein [Bacillota bacterium]